MVMVATCKTACKIGVIISEIDGTIWEVVVADIVAEECTDKT